MASRPNFIIVMSDQQRSDSLGCYGNRFTETPHVDALAAAGARFANSFTEFPLCTPARATAWTGLYPSAHGLIDCVYNVANVFDYNYARVTVFDLLRDAGYDAAYFGKWHLGDENPGAFAKWDGFNSLGGHWVDGRQAFQGGVYRADVETDHAIDYLRSRQGQSAPFVLVQSYYPPHDPFTAPTRFYAPYRHRGVPFAGYYAAISALDWNLGRLVEALDRFQLRDNTLLFYVSDHGEHFLSRGGADHKATGHDDSIRVPIVVNAPGLVRPGAWEQPVGLQDLAPTMVDYAGIDRAPAMHGASLRPFLEGRAPAWRDAFYIENLTEGRPTLDGFHIGRKDGMTLDDPKLRIAQRALWTPEWKLIVDAEGRHELYDLTNDPEEVLNVFGAPHDRDVQEQFRHFPDMGPVIDRLLRRLEEAARGIGDRFGIDLAATVRQSLEG